MLEFTGERVIPGEVDADLWNEHYARYLFAARLCRNRRVVDLGCGTGYGAAELARSATHVWGIDLSPDAILYASEKYQHPNLDFRAAPCQRTELPDDSADLVVAFELIEHLAEPEALIAEARRLLTPSGQFVLSTPNLDFYRETRRQSGPNPFHQHEFVETEFRQILESHFPYVTLFTQNHTPAISIQPSLPIGSAPPIVHLDRIGQDRIGQDTLNDDTLGPHTSDAHFFIAVCSTVPQVGAPHFLFVPQTGNVLAERQRHIELLQGELKLKQEWLDRSLADHQQLAAAHDALHQKLAAANDWARTTESQLAEKVVHIATTEQHLAAAQQQLSQVTSHLQRRDREIDEKIRHVAILEQQLHEHAGTIHQLSEALTQQSTLLDQTVLEKAQLAELYRELTERHQQFVEALSAIEADRDRAVHETTAAREQASQLLGLLDSAERTVEERTRWAQSLDAELTQLRHRMAEANTSRWLRLGRRLNLGPDLQL